MRVTKEREIDGQAKASCIRAVEPVQLLWLSNLPNCSPNVALVALSKLHLQDQAWQLWSCLLKLLRGKEIVILIHTAGNLTASTSHMLHATPADNTTKCSCQTPILSMSVNVETVTHQCPETLHQVQHDHIKRCNTFAQELHCWKSTFKVIDITPAALAWNAQTLAFLCNGPGQCAQREIVPRSGHLHSAGHFHGPS